jgi:hypothetical protein
MPFRYGEVGNCLKAKRLESGLIANRPGISRAKREAHKRTFASHVAGRIDQVA